MRGCAWLKSARCGGKARCRVGRWWRGVSHGSVAPDTAITGLEVRRWPPWMVVASLARLRAGCSHGFELLEGR
eukprot:14782709-Alexandrium_andersonii.AAC.1